MTLRTKLHLKTLSVFIPIVLYVLGLIFYVEVFAVITAVLCVSAVSTGVYRVIYENFKDCP